MLVVLGNSFPTGNYNNNYKFIYGFNMPLFFWISGFCAISIYKLKCRNNIKEFYKRKFNRWIIPYFTITLLAVPVELILNKFSQRPLVINELIKEILVCLVNSPVIYLWYVECSNSNRHIISTIFSYFCSISCNAIFCIYV